MVKKYRNCGNLTKILIGHDNHGMGPGAHQPSRAQLFLATPLSQPGQRTAWLILVRPPNHANSRWRTRPPVADHSWPSRPSLDSALLHANAPIKPYQHSSPTCDLAHDQAG